MNMKFRILKKDKKTDARAGVISTSHGTIRTPAYMPVATKATVKALHSEMMHDLDADVLMCNTYHLFLQPGERLVKKFGGLHGFMGWNKPIMTDSAGFQVFSLGFGMEDGTNKFGGFFPGEDRGRRKEGKKQAVVTDDGVVFHADGKKVLFTPEKSIRLQEDLGADLIIAFDECTSPMAEYDYVKESMERTHRWAERCLKVKKRKDQALFGVVQGSRYKDLRKEAARFIASRPFEGICIGGSLGDTKKEMHKILEWVVEELPEGKPRHLLGIGTVEDFFEAVERGVDMFDCVGPTRIARVGYLYISPASGGNKKNKFRLKIKNRKYENDKKPIDKACVCFVCKKYSRAYIRHLFKANELTAFTLASYHNVHFMLSLMKEIRESILKGRFLQLKKKWMT